MDCQLFSSMLIPFFQFCVGLAFSLEVCFSELAQVVYLVYCWFFRGRLSLHSCGFGCRFAYFRRTLFGSSQYWHLTSLNEVMEVWLLRWPFRTNDWFGWFSCRLNNGLLLWFSNLQCRLVSWRGLATYSYHLCLDNRFFCNFHNLNRRSYQLLPYAVLFSALLH